MATITQPVAGVQTIMLSEIRHDQGAALVLPARGACDQRHAGAGRQALGT